MIKLTRRELLGRARTVAIGGVAPSALPRASARVGIGHCGWSIDSAATSLAAYREIGHRAYFS
jgi:hypothetical protein